MTFPLDLNAKTPLGEYFVFFTAKTKFQGKEMAGIAPPLVLVLGLPFDLQVAPTSLSLKPGDKMKLKVNAVRKGGYKGPISLEIRKLPANVTAAKAIIAADQTSRGGDRGSRPPPRRRSSTSMPRGSRPRSTILPMLLPCSPCACSEMR